MSVLVVDQLEVVQVDEEQRATGPVPAGAFPALNQTLGQQGAVGETGEPVPHGALFENFLLSLQVLQEMLCAALCQPGQAAKR